MRVIGLTGSIGMGKTNAARALRQLGVPVLEADGVVHRLTAAHGRALPAINAAFPGTVTEGRLDRGKRAGMVFGNDAALKRLEGILHPLFEAEERRFIARSRAHRVALVAVDIPLLYEVGAERHMDAVIVMTAPKMIQRARVMRRRGMTQARLDAILARQMPDHAKRRRADFVVRTGTTRRDTVRKLKIIVDNLRQAPRSRGKRPTVLALR